MTTGLIQKKFSPRIPHFFTIILQKTLTNNKIQIPKKIVRKCGGTLEEQVWLKLPCGLDWEIGLTKSSDGKVWFDKGWPEFSKHYSIVCGHLLVFRYQGNSQFQVAVFDKSTVEIDYRCGIIKQVKEEPQCDEIPVRSPSSRPIKRMRINPDGELTLLGKQSQTEKCVPAQRLSSKEKAEALERARGFESNHPFFVLPMQPSYVKLRCGLNVPRHFAKSYLGTGVKYVTLKAPRDGTDATWSVKYSLKGFDCRNSKPKFEAGWRKFVLDNGLKRGDVCVFAMTKSVGSIVFEVSIYREKRNANSSLLPGPKLEPVRRLKPPFVAGEARALEINRPLSRSKVLELEENRSNASEATKRFRSENPFFQVDFAFSHVEKATLSIPVSFGRSYLEAKTQLVRLMVGERSWPVKLLYGDPMKYRFSRGWSVFATENSLRPGDVCIFELIIKRNRAVFQVSIFSSDQI